MASLRAIACASDGSVHLHAMCQSLRNIALESTHRDIHRFTREWYVENHLRDYGDCHQFEMWPLKVSTASSNRLGQPSIRCFPAFASRNTPEYASPKCRAFSFNRYELKPVSATTHDARICEIAAQSCLGFEVETSMLSPVLRSLS